MDIIGPSLDSMARTMANVWIMFEILDGVFTSRRVDPFDGSRSGCAMVMCRREGMEGCEGFNGGIRYRGRGSREGPAKTIRKLITLAMAWDQVLYQLAVISSFVQV